MSRPDKEASYFAARLCQLDLTPRERAQAATLLGRLGPAYASKQILVLIPHLDYDGKENAEIRAAVFDAVVSLHVAGLDVLKHLRDWLRLTTQGEVTHGLPATAKVLEVCELITLVNTPHQQLLTLERLEALWRTD